MTKIELKEKLKDYMINLTDMLFKVIDAFPDEVNWGWKEVWHALKFCTGCGYNASIKKVIDNIKLSDSLNKWPPQPNEYTFQNEVKGETYCTRKEK